MSNIGKGILGLIFFNIVSLVLILIGSKMNSTIIMVSGSLWFTVGIQWYQCFLHAESDRKIKELEEKINENH